MRDFATSNIKLPEGEHVGRRLRIRRQPYVGLWFDALDSGRWRRAVMIGCVQGGKTMSAFVIPVLRHLFGHFRETVVCGTPTMQLGKNKWEEELLPAIKASWFKKYLPTEGEGSRGGWAEEIHFTNGAKLKFMGGKGGDEQRSGFTTRVVAITEVDKMDKARAASRETDPISQMEARADSYDEDRRVVYLECTVSFETGRIWIEWSAGTASRIACPCPHCGEHVTPEREHLFGWKDAATRKEAKRLAVFLCPECGEAIDDRQRRRMNLDAVLVHRGQQIDRHGTITGDPPETDTLGFRFTAFNNMFWTIGTIAAKHWDAARADDEEAAEKELCQFYWAMPYKSPEWDAAPLDPEKLQRRLAERLFPKGVVPGDAEYFTMACDVHKRLLWWIAIAWRPAGRGHVVDYGIWEIASDDMDLKRAIMIALREWRDELVMKTFCTPDGKVRLPEQAWIDARYQGDVVYAFCRESGNRFRPSLGCGGGQHYSQSYSHPGKRSGQIKYIGQQYNIRWSAEHRVHYVLVNADHWKSHFHQRLTTPVGQPGAMELYFSTNRKEHARVSRHFTAEESSEEFVPGVGMVIKWKPLRDNNHLLDAGYNATAAGHLCGVRIVRGQPADHPAAPRQSKPPLLTPDGRPFLITERREL